MKLALMCDEYDGMKIYVYYLYDLEVQVAIVKCDLKLMQMSLTKCGCSIMNNGWNETLLTYLIFLANDFFNAIYSTT